MNKTWRKSSYSGTSNDCVEIRRTLDAVRDSKNPAGGALVFDQDTAARFVSAVKNGRFDG